jgi:hypothetical protein
MVFWELILIISNLSKPGLVCQYFVVTIALLLYITKRCVCFCNRWISGRRRETIAAIQPRHREFVTVLQIPCSASEQDENSLFQRFWAP